ncbi:hypothetical protein AACH06_29110 [Ideonella sp. DXS29W]|uniref:Uncharacterized protein n=1 Tax=Ideonella lacteola TaxID=2984193 RepID=A0ABU9BYP8_9BURK
MPSRATALIIACAASAMASTEAAAMGFGRLTASAVLGQPLNLPIPLRLDPGERLEPECVAADVTVGDNVISRERIRVRLEPGQGGADAVARVTTQMPIDEPVIEVTLMVGCDRRFSRRFVAFADPPADSTRIASQAGVATLAAPMTSPVSPGDSPSATELPRTSPRSQQQGASSGASSARAQAEASAKAGRAARKSEAAATRQAERAAKREAKRRVAASKSTTPPNDVVRGPVARSAAADDGARLVLEMDGPRLKLDMEDPVFMPQVQGAAGVASAPDSEGAGAAVSEAERLQLLEKALRDLQRDSQAGREAAAALRARLAEAENRGRAVPWLVALVVLSLGVAIWLARRLRRQQDVAEGAPNWWSAEAGAAADDGAGVMPAAPATLATPEMRGAGEAPGRTPLSSVDVPLEVGFGPRREAPDTSPLPAALALERDLPQPASATSLRAPASLPTVMVRPEPVHERTMIIPSPPPFLMDAANNEPTAREVSVEELLDLEQQADFFIALGQEEAAVDLLMSHLRSTGGLSPLPYTKLLEIYRRQGDRDAYERIRTRFNRRFNAYAPEWEDGPLSGRSLEDYAEVVQHLQTLWPEPLDAMAMLEAMLFRKDAAYELFDLPAYKDVLVLYALARDLLQQAGAGVAGVVDVLLPLGDEVVVRDAPPAPAGSAKPDELASFELTAYALPPHADSAEPMRLEEGSPDAEPTLDPPRRRVR